MKRTKKHMNKANWGTLSSAGEYSIIEYVVGDGPPEDPGSTVYRRVAIYEKSATPEDFQAALTEAMKERWSYDGLKDALTDEIVEIVQEGDYSANEHREANDRLLDAETMPYAWRQKSNGLTYEAFLEAIDVVAEDRENEEAWAVIDKWRQRQLRDDERG